MSRPNSRMTYIVAAVAALVVAVTPSLAAKPGPTLGPELDGRVANGAYTVNGSGFEPGELIVLNIGEADGCCTALNVVADASGNITFTSSTSGPGAYSVKAATLTHGKWRFVAEWYFDVY